jgi:hypothetical protein
MPTWIEAALEAAASSLARIGETELAATLERLRDEPDIKALKLYRSLAVAELADELYDCDSLEYYFGLIERVAREFGVEHCTVHCVRERSTAYFGTKVLTTFPKDWVKQYVDRRYSTIDPVVARCRLGEGVFFWDELVSSDPITKYFVKSCVEAGIGPAGVTVVELATNGGLIGVTLSSVADHGTFRRDFQARLPDFCELKVLRALAAGKPLSEVETFHFLYGSFKTIEKSILRCFGARTLAQATAIAANMGLLENLPYFEEDIFTSRDEPVLEDA